MPELIAQITDSHVGVGPGDTASVAALEAAVEAIGQLDPPPVAVLFTGDLTANGRLEEYERVRELLAPLAMPVHPLMGNHDDREAFRAGFADHPGVVADPEFVQYTAQCGPVTVICCDTHDPDWYGGRLGPDRLEWLATELQRTAGSPTVVAMHHPPLLTGIHEFDAKIPLAPEDRSAVAALRPQPDLIVAGHIHLPVRGMLGPTPVFVCPSVDLQAAFDLRREVPVRLVPDPPAYAVHIHGADPSLISLVRPLPGRRPTD